MFHLIHYFQNIVKNVKKSQLAAQARDEDSRLEFIERFAAVLTDAGFPPMPARVFACLLCTDSGMLTSADLARLLRISPAAISGAIRYLGQINLVSRLRQSGSRRDCYHVHDDVWYEAITRRDHMLSRLERGVREGVEVLGRNTRAGQRMAETLAYFEFVQQELPALAERWRARKNALGNRRGR